MKPLEEETDFYFNEDGLMVLTENYLRERGYCCGNGCKHCPYDYEAVAEPRRSQLLQQRNAHGDPTQEK
jgi:hypothetical protein